VEYREVSNSIDVPRNTGTEGFIQTVRAILRRSRVQEIRITADGKVSYRRLVQGYEEPTLSVDLETLTPMAVARRSELHELTLPPSLPAAISISKMFDRFAIDQIFPVIWGVSPATVFWKWFEATSRSALHSRSHAFGLPVVADRHIPDTALLLFGARNPGASLIDTTNVLKLEMEESVLKPPETTVEINL